MKTRPVRSNRSQQTETAATPRQKPRPLGALVSFFSKTPVVDSENHPAFRGAPTSRPNAFLMTAGG